MAESQAKITHFLSLLAQAAQVHLSESRGLELCYCVWTCTRAFVGRQLQDFGVGKGWRIYITHADAQQSAEQALILLKALIPSATFEIHPLSPVFITQGGPSCVAIQAIHE